MNYGKMSNETHLEDLCENCGGRRGLHNHMNQKCPKDTNNNADHIEYRDTVFAIKSPSPDPSILLEALKEIRDYRRHWNEVNHTVDIDTIQELARVAVNKYREKISSGTSVKGDEQDKKTENQWMIAGKHGLYTGSALKRSHMIEQHVKLMRKTWMDLKRIGDYPVKVKITYTSQNKSK